MKKVNLSVKDEKTLQTARITAVSFESFIFLTVVLSLVVYTSQRVNFVLGFWPFAFAIPFLVILVFIAKREKIYLNSHWIAVVLLLMLVWLPITTIFGMMAVEMSFWTLVEIGVSYGIGYASARHVRVNRLLKHKHIKLSLFINFMLLLLIGFVAFPVCMSILSWTLFHVQVNMMHYFVLGFSVPFSMLLNYYMFYALYDDRGIAVIKDTVTHLVLVCLRNTMIVAMGLWIVFLVGIPPLL